MVNAVSRRLMPLAILPFLACTSGPCRQLKHPELAATQATKTPESEGDAAATGAGVAAGSNELKIVDGRVFVSRPDGSLQCGMAKGRTTEEMEKDLGGIKVYSRAKRPDGKMHIQVCGSPTGILNVYEIPVSSQKDAERRGFKVF